MWCVTLRAGAALSLTEQMEAAREPLSSFYSRSRHRKQTGEEAVVLRRHAGSLKARELLWGQEEGATMGPLAFRYGSPVVFYGCLFFFG